MGNVCRMEPLRRLHLPEDVLEHAAAAAARDPLAAAECRRVLLALKRADEERGSDLERTLLTYYACGASVSATAQALFLHRNSVRYRLDRVRALLGADIDHPRVSAMLLLAFAVYSERSREDENRATERAQ